MRRGEIFWGVLLVLLGALFFLKTAGYLIGDVFSWFWPLVIVAAGIWMVMGGFAARPESQSPDDFAVPLQGAKAAGLTINHGVGRMELHAGSTGDVFLTGTAAVVMNRSARLIGDRLEVSIDAGPSFFPFLGPQGGAWIYRLNPDVPMTLSVHAGASQLELDLADLQVTTFTYDGGASSLNVTLPARVANVTAEVQAGAASVHLRVPTGVAARLLVKSVGSFGIDQARFKARGPGLYQSADYDAAQYRADISIDGGATSILVD